MWCVAELDDEYIERMEDILDLYERPYDERYPVVCLDEKSTQLLADVRKPVRVRDGSLRRDYEYRRKGTANLFVGVEPKAGLHLGTVTTTRDHMEFAWMLVEIAQTYPDAKRIDLVIDNLSTHSERSLIKAFGPVDGRRLWRRFRVHFTPKHASWLNQAEIEISLVSRECLGTHRFPTHAGLARAYTQWRRRANEQQRRIDWRFTKDDARDRFHYPRPPPLP